MTNYSSAPDDLIALISNTSDKRDQPTLPETEPQSVSTDEAPNMAETTPEEDYIYFTTEQICQLLRREATQAERDDHEAKMTEDQLKINDIMAENDLLYDEIARLIEEKVYTAEEWDMFMQIMNED